MNPNKHRMAQNKQAVWRIAYRIGVLVVFCFIGLSSPWTPPALAYDPHLRLPWAPGASYRISGSQYGQGLHTTATDYYAIDFGVAFNNEVHAAQGGYATTFPNQGVSPSYGNYIVIDHGNGFTTLYAHLNMFAIGNGVNVTQGQLIGYAGDTGAPGSPHLHFVARFNGTAYMPEPMSGYTGFGNPANFQSTVYTNNIQPSNVIQNGDQWAYPVMSDNGNGPWQRSTASNYAVYCCGPDGNNYLEMNTGVFGSASVWQDFPAYDNNWSNFTHVNTFINTPDTWTLRAAIRSTCGGGQGTIALWSLYGPPQEVGSTPFVANGLWQIFTATTLFASNGHNRLRAIFYMDTANCNYDFDVISLQRNYIINSSYENGWGPWNTGHAQANCFVNLAIYNYANSFRPGKDDASFLETNRNNCTTGWASISQDVTAYPAIGDTYYARIWVRSALGAPIQGTLALWALGGNQEVGAIHYVIPSGDSNWREVATSVQLNQPSHNAFRVEMYIDTNMDASGTQQYNFDGIQVWGGAGN